jgi:hypothetical protein
MRRNGKLTLAPMHRSGRAGLSVWKDDRVRAAANSCSRGSFRRLCDFLRFFALFAFSLANASGNRQDSDQAKE